MNTELTSPDFTSIDLTSIDLTDVKWHTDGPPHELFARMRREAPVRWNPTGPDSGFWSVTSHELVTQVSKDPATFSSHRAGVFLHPDQVVPLDLTRNLLMYKDPPEHTKYRQILQKAFTPHAVAKLEDAVRARATKIIDAVIERGRCDLVRDIAVPGPLGVLAELMGLPDDDIERLFHWSEKITEASNFPEPNAAVETFGELAGYLFEQIERQKAEGNDETLVMRLRAAEVDGQKLDDSEILVFFALLIFAGNDTTRNTQAHGFQVLLEHPEQLAILREDPSLIPQAIEEILRYTSVVQFFARTVTTDTELGGQALAEGDQVVIWYTSASRDEAVFDDPDRFDVLRKKDDHKAFGGGGRHFCLGAGLARLELRVVLEELLRRMPDLQLAGPVERLPAAWANMVTSVPVTFTPGAREAAA